MRLWILVLLACQVGSACALAEDNPPVKEEVLAGLRPFAAKTARPDGSFRPGVDPDYPGMSDSAASDLAPPTYAVIVHRTFGWQLPEEAQTRTFFLGRQQQDGAFVNKAGTLDPRSSGARLYNTTQGLVALHGLGAKPRFDPLPVFGAIMQGDYKELPPYTTSFFPLAYATQGKQLPRDADKKIRALMVQDKDGYMHNHVANTFHLAHYYSLMKEPTPLADAMLARILKEQKEDGSWLINPLARDRHATFDAVFTLKHLGKGRQDCRTAIAKAGQWALRCRNPDGGFGHYPGSPSDWDAVYFQVGTLVMAGVLPPADKLPADAHLLGWGHLLASAPDRPAEQTSTWPQFLGPNRNGMSAETGLNWDWKSQPPKVLWKTPLGNGFSSLCVVGERLFTQAKRGPRDLVVCLSTKDGRELWSYDAAPSYLDLQRQGAGPRSTPTYHDGKVYCLFAQGELVCLTTEGKLVWQKDIFKDTGTVKPVQRYFYFGVAFSPLVEGDLVIVQPGGDKNNSVVAFHKDTGELVWSSGSDPIGYASPIMITARGTRQLVCPTGTSYLGIDAAKGTVLWRHPFGSDFKINCANPVWSDGLLFASAAYGTGSAVLDIVKTPGDGWAVKEKWRSKKTMQNLFATSIALDKKVYGCSGDLQALFLRCLDLESGRMHWEERLPERVHLLAVDGRMLQWGEQGNLRFFKPNPTSYDVQGEMLGLLSFKSWAVPALAGGRLYLRDDNHVLCLDLRKH